MILLRTGRAGEGSQPITVPDNCVRIIDFVCAGIYQDGIGGDQPSRAFISADLNDTPANILAGGSAGLLAVANSQFPQIPVSAGEKLLVLFSGGASTTVIYFRDEEA
jgi:hypothetical protein